MLTVVRFPNVVLMNKKAEIQDKFDSASLLSVSYTHLDVYKRQPFYSGNQFGIHFLIQPDECFGQRILLTFLCLYIDVYKRQGWMASPPVKTIPSSRDTI